MTESKVNQWEPQGGYWYVHGDGVVHFGNPNPNHGSFGTEYPTKELAEWASKQMRSFNRLLCYVAEHTEGVPEDIVINTTSGLHHCNVYVPLQSDRRDVLTNKIESGEVTL